ncbi:hypothetical protein AB0O82_35115 [Kitasatospora sp. NPDC088264]|uniref:hypothetical protein n=1 Tax=Kitasatospora sp. NPDC088264 TaxID=3155296 RepID=UPI003432F7EA
MVLDQEGFTERPSAVQAALSAAIGRVVDEALSAAGLDHVRDHKRFARNTGDGLVFGCAPGHLPALTHPFLAELESALAREHVRAGTTPIRLRAAISAGPLPVDGGPGDGSGTARNEAHRLVDSTVLKHALAQANPEATHLVAIVSDQVYRDVVLAGYSGLHHSRFTPVLAAVTGKKFRQSAWVHVPVPSGGLVALPPPNEDVPPHTAAPERVPLTARPPHQETVAQQVQQGVALANGACGDVNLSFAQVTEPAVAEERHR